MHQLLKANLAEDSTTWRNFISAMSLQKAERKKETLVAIRQIFGKIKTFNGTSTCKRRTFEQQKKLKQIEGARYWGRIRQYKEIMKAHGWNEAAPTVIPDSLRALTPTSLQINSSPLPEPVCHYQIQLCLHPTRNSPRVHHRNRCKSHHGVGCPIICLPIISFEKGPEN